MVDVSDKAVTARTAVAEGFVAMAPETLALVQSGDGAEGRRARRPRASPASWRPSARTS